MATIKFKKIPTEHIKNQMPVLYDTVQERFKDLSTEDKERIYGLSIEIALKSRGSVELFEEDDLTNLTIENED